MFAVRRPGVSRSGEDNPILQRSRGRSGTWSAARVPAGVHLADGARFHEHAGGLDTASCSRGGVALSAQAVGSVTTRSGVTEIAPLWELELRRREKHFGFQANFDGVSARVRGCGRLHRQPDAVRSARVVPGRSTGSPMRSSPGATGSFRVNARGNTTSSSAARSRRTSSFFTGTPRSGGWVLDFSAGSRISVRRRLYQGTRSTDRAGVWSTPSRRIPARHDAEHGGPRPPSYAVGRSLLRPAQRDGRRDVNYIAVERRDILFMDSQISFRPTNSSGRADVRVDTLTAAHRRPASCR
jgi:hypothetical protein